MHHQPPKPRRDHTGPLLFLLLLVAVFIATGYWTLERIEDDKRAIERIKNR